MGEGSKRRTAWTIWKNHELNWDRFLVTGLASMQVQGPWLWLFWDLWLGCEAKLHLEWIVLLHDTKGSSSHVRDFFPRIQRFPSRVRDSSHQRFSRRKWIFYWKFCWRSRKAKESNYTNLPVRLCKSLNILCSISSPNHDNDEKVGDMTCRQDMLHFSIWKRYNVT